MSDDTERQTRKAAAAVEFTRRRLAQASEAIERAQAKLAKAQDEVTAAQLAVDAALADHAAVAQELTEFEAAAPAPEQPSTGATAVAGGLDASIVTESPEG